MPPSLAELLGEEYKKVAALVIEYGKVTYVRQLEARRLGSL